ncbi:MAG: molybdenum cofactor guanylyltransferase MobA [Arcobacteraceae bacterium]
MIDIPCVILCGGASKRMGEDKSLLPFKNFNTLIEYQHHKLSKIFSTVYISAKSNKFDFNASILYDESQEIYSPMQALYSILKNIKEEKIFIITVDVPFIKKKTIEQLVKYSPIYEISIAKDNLHTHNLCGVYSKKILPIIKKLLEDNIHKINTLINLSQNSHIEHFINEKQFTNINTKDEYNKYIL